MTGYSNQPIPKEAAKQLLKDENIPYCSAYGDIVASDSDNDYGATLIDCKLHCTGCQRTGCMFCGFGAHLEKGLGYGRVLDYIGVRY
jgi:hypothetical protein